MITFEGYRRGNGDVGIRNHILVLSSVVCANHVVSRIAETSDLAVAFCHGNGCGQIGADKEQTQRTLEGIGRNPNAGAVLIVSLGCEGISARRIYDAVSATGKPTELLVIQEHGGTTGSIAAGVAIVKRWEPLILGAKRQSVPLSELTLALECGGSDATSGITANPLCGWVSDRIVENGGTVILSETTEMIGAEKILAERACCPSVASELLAIVDAVEAGAKGMKVDLRGTQPTPGNIAGGLSTIEEKSLGCIAKAGTSTVNEVLRYADEPQRKGLVVMDSPGFDVESIVGMLAGGAQIVFFTTGRGTPVGAPIAPVVKITGNPETYERMTENFDFDASGILSGVRKVDDAGRALLKLMLEVLSGRRTQSEILGHCEASITRIGPSV